MSPWGYISLSGQVFTPTLAVHKELFTHVQLCPGSLDWVPALNEVFTAFYQIDLSQFPHSTKGARGVSTVSTSQMNPLTAAIQTNHPNTLLPLQTFTTKDKSHQHLSKKLLATTSELFRSSSPQLQPGLMCCCLVTLMHLSFAPLLPLQTISFHVPLWPLPVSQVGFYIYKFILEPLHVLHRKRKLQQLAFPLNPIWSWLIAVFNHYSRLPLATIRPPKPHDTVLSRLCSQLLLLHVLCFFLVLWFPFPQSYSTAHSRLSQTSRQTTSSNTLASECCFYFGVTDVALQHSLVSLNKPCKVMNWDKTRMCVSTNLWFRYSPSFQFQKCLSGQRLWKSTSEM